MINYVLSCCKTYFFGKAFCGIFIAFVGVGASVLRPCSTPDAATLGKWNRNNGELVSSTPHLCGSTIGPKYLCTSQAFTHATYTPATCFILNFTESSSMLRETSILFVGDSLIREIYEATQCALLRAGVEDPVASYVTSTHLRGDYPCLADCTDKVARTNNTTFRDTFHCSGCAKDGKPKQEDIGLIPWVVDLKKSTYSTLVLSTGAWYTQVYLTTSNLNVRGPDLDALDAWILREYESSLDKVAELTLQLSTKNNIRIIWLGLPPCQINKTVRWWWSDIKHSWHLFTRFDAIARAKLGSTVQFLNVSQLTEERKRHDPAVSYDGLHWCNGAATAIPFLITDIIFHLLASPAK